MSRGSRWGFWRANIFQYVFWLIEYIVSVLWPFPCMFVPCWHHHIYLNIFSFNISNFTWIPNIVIFHNNQVTYNDIMDPIWNSICYLIWWQWRWQWHVLSYFTVIAVDVSHFNDRLSSNSKMTIWNSWVLQTMFHGSNFMIVDWISASSIWIVLTVGRSLETTVAKSTEFCITIDPLPLFLTCSPIPAFAAPPMQWTMPLPCEVAKYFQETGRFRCCESRHRSFPVMNWFLNSLDGPSE